MNRELKTLLDQAAGNGELCLPEGDGDDILRKVISAIKKRRIALIKLDLSDSTVGNEGIKALTASPHMATLQQLNLSGTRVDDEGVEALATSPHMATLQQLNLAKTRVGNEGLKALTLSKHMAALQDLGLYNTRVGNEGLKALVDSPHLPALKRLSLGGTRVGDKGICALVASPRLAKLPNLNLSGTRVGDVTVRALVASPHWTALKDLRFRNTQVTDEGIKELARSPYLAALQRLSLAHTQVTDVGVKELARSPYLTSLKRLSLRETPRVSDEGIRALAASRFLPALEELHLEGAGTTLPAELIERAEAEAIFKHLRQREKGWPLAEIKLLVLGQGRVGKTHLVKWLSRDTFYFNPQQDPTHDVEESEIVLRWPAELGNGPDKVKGRMWDFGGQPELHSTHQFFLAAQRCFYLLVLRADAAANGEEATANRLSYWLRMIAHHGRHQDERAPVLIAVTHCDLIDSNPEAAKSYDELMTALRQAKDKEWYGARVVGEPVGGLGYSENATSRPDRQRHWVACNKVRDAIQQNLASVPDIKNPYPPSFFAMKREIEYVFSPSQLDGDGRGKDFFDRTGRWFAKVREEHGIDERLAAGWLDIHNSLGITHWLGGRKDVKTGRNTELQNHVYNPAWVRKPVYKLIRLKGGVITYDEQGQQLDEFKFNKEQENSIFNLMKACRLAYDCEDSQLLGSLLIPDTLEPNPHSMCSDAPFRELQPARLKADFLPEKAFLRLVAEWYQRIKPAPLRHCFRNEVYFEWPVRGQTIPVPILVRTVLSPPDGEVPHLELYIVDKDKKIRRKVIDKLEQVMEGIFKSEHLSDCWIGAASLQSETASASKRSTAAGDAQTKLVAELSKHHKYDDGSLLNQDPIGLRELARKADVAEATANKFFNDKFANGERKGHSKYKVACRHRDTLIACLKALRAEFSPWQLFGAQPPDEHGWDDDE